MPRPLATLPGPAGLPLVGNLPALAHDPLGFFTRVAREHGPMARFRVGARDIVLLTEPDLIEALLVTHRAATVKDPVTASLSEVLGQGLLTSEGETWRARRRLVAPSFQPQHIAALGDQMVSITDELLATLPDGPRDVHPDTMALTLDIAVQTLFGTRLDDTRRVGPLLEQMMGAFHLRMHTWRRLLPAWVPTDARRITVAARDDLRALLLALVQRRRGAGGDDLLARLLEARDDEGVGLTDEELLDEVVTLFLAGHETTALAVGFALRLVGAHPEVRARVTDELDRVLAGRTPTARDVRSLPYLDAVVTETMRLYPPAWAIAREVTEDVVVGDVALPAGTSVVMPQWVVHRDPRWYDAPEAFRPERWSEASDRPKFAYFPFGGGPRVCVGNHFARMEAMLVLARWFSAFHVEADGAPMELLPSVTLRPVHGLPVTLTRRAGARGVAAA